MYARNHGEQMPGTPTRLDYGFCDPGSAQASSPVPASPDYFRMKSGSAQLWKQAESSSRFGGVIIVGLDRPFTLEP